MFRKFKCNSAHQKSALYLEKQKSQKNSIKCAQCSGGRSDLIVPFKLSAQKKLILKISEKLVVKQGKCAQISPLAFLSIAPLKDTKMSKNEQKSLKTAKKATIFYTGRKNIYNRNCLFYVKFFEFEVKSYSPFFGLSILCL